MGDRFTERMWLTRSTTLTPDEADTILYRPDLNRRHNGEYELAMSEGAYAPNLLNRPQFEAQVNDPGMVGYYMVVHTEQPLFLKRVVVKSVIKDVFLMGLTTYINGSSFGNTSSIRTADVRIEGTKVQNITATFASKSGEFLRTMSAENTYQSIATARNEPTAKAFTDTFEEPSGGTEA